jgi:hypothetical protein
MSNSIDSDEVLRKRSPVERALNSMDSDPESP